MLSRQVYSFLQTWTSATTRPMDQFPWAVAILLALGLLGVGYIITYILVLANKE